jgi:hypothetical protein
MRHTTLLYQFLGGNVSKSRVLKLRYGRQTLYSDFAAYGFKVELKGFKEELDIAIASTPPSFDHFRN